MAKRRDISLGKYGISKNRYRELLYFCRQYQEKKDKLHDLTYMSAVKYDSLSGTGSQESSTERIALEMADLRFDIQLIERSAIDADSGIHQHLLMNVTQGVQYEHLPVPCGRRQFYEARRKFFWLLSLKKG